MDLFKKINYMEGSELFNCELENLTKSKKVPDFLILNRIRDFLFCKIELSVSAEYT